MASKVTKSTKSTGVAKAAKGKPIKPAFFKNKGATPSKARAATASKTKGTTASKTKGGSDELVAKKAPAFTLPDQDGTPVSLASLTARGNVVLYFYPKDMT